MQNGLPGFESGRSFDRPDLSLVAGVQGPGKSGRNTLTHPQKSYPFFFIVPYILNEGNARFFVDRALKEHKLSFLVSS
jgi:hypothetical protein